MRCECDNGEDNLIDLGMWTRKCRRSLSGVCDIILQYIGQKTIIDERQSEAEHVLAGFSSWVTFIDDVPPNDTTGEVVIAAACVH